MPLCPVCQNTADADEQIDVNRRAVRCAGCGRFIITDAAVDLLESDNSKRGIISHWIRCAWEKGQRPEIDQKHLQAILCEQSLPSVSEQTNSLLLWLGDELSSLGTPAARVQLQNSRRRLTALLGAAPQPENEGLHYLLQELAERKLIFPATTFLDAAGLTFDGWQKYEDLKRARTESRLAFMAMPFKGDLFNRLFAVFKVAVAQTGFDLRRIDDRPPAGLIDNRLRVEIRKSRFMVCELTNENAGAYWEGGFAEGLGRPVIYSCEKSYFEREKTHFDANHSHTVRWEESDNFQDGAEQLKATIRATLPGEAKLVDE